MRDLASNQQGIRWPRVIAAWTRGMLLSAERAGLSAKELLVSAGLSELDLEDRDAPVDVQRHLYMVREIVRMQPGINTGLRTGMMATTARFGVLCNVLRYARNLHSALSDYIRFQRLVTDVTTWTLTRKPTCQLTLPMHPLLDPVPSACEVQLATIIAVSRQLTDTVLVPRSVSFRHQPSGDSAEHRQFFGCSVNFRSEEDCIQLDPWQLDLPIVSAHELAHRHFLSSVEAVLRMDTGLAQASEAIRQYVIKSLQHGPPRRDDAARFLGVTPRTMQRQLEKEGQTFEKLLDAGRRDLALAYVADLKLATFEIAGLLGFTEPSAFFRAFRRWTGQSPQQYRRTAATVV